MDATETATVAADQLRSVIERVEALDEARAAAVEAMKEVYDEAKANGYDVKTLRKVVALRKVSPAERSEAEAMLDLYLNALGMA